MKRYDEYKETEIPWLNSMPAHWEEKRAKYLFKKENRLPEENAEVITCFRDGTVTLRKNRRTTGFTESLKEIGYQGKLSFEFAYGSLPEELLPIWLNMVYATGEYMLSVYNSKL